MATTTTNSTSVYVAFGAAANLLRQAITVLRAAGESESNGAFGQCVCDLERIYGVCHDRSKPATVPAALPITPTVQAPAPVAKPTAKPAAAAQTVKADAPKAAPSSTVACKGCKAACNPGFLSNGGYCRKPACQAKCQPAKPVATPAPAAKPAVSTGTVAQLVAAVTAPATPKAVALPKAAPVATPAPVAKPVAATPAVKPAPVAKPADDKAALLDQYAKLGGNAGLAAKWGADAIRRNIDKLAASAKSVAPKAAAPAPAPVAKPVAPKAGTILVADGKGGVREATEADLWAALERLAGGKKAAA